MITSSREERVPVGFEIAGVVVITAIAVAGIVLRRESRTREPRTQAPPEPVAARVISGEVEVLRPNASSVEGLEIRYAADALVRSVRVGAMNSEHKELLMTMNGVQWRTLPNSQKQEVLAAARSTWAAKMCRSGPDIAYVILQTEAGEIVGRASPHSVTVS